MAADAERRRAITEATNLIDRHLTWLQRLVCGAGGWICSSAKEVEMSVDLIVYLRRSEMPSPAGWQQALVAAGMPIELDTDFDPDTFSGFLPCKLRALSGFEYSAGTLSRAEAVESGAPTGADFSVTLVTGSDMNEFACSVVAAGALAQASDGLLVDPQSGESFLGAQAMAWAAEQFAEAERE